VGLTKSTAGHSVQMLLWRGGGFLARRVGVQIRFLCCFREYSFSPFLENCPPPGVCIPKPEAISFCSVGFSAMRSLLPLFAVASRGALEFPSSPFFPFAPLCVLFGRLTEVPSPPLASFGAGLLCFFEWPNGGSIGRVPLPFDLRSCFETATWPP